MRGEDLGFGVWDPKLVKKRFSGFGVWGLGARAQGLGGRDQTYN